MNITQLAEKLMGMDERSWRRHANPWSVYSRFTILPLISLAFWSRQWLGIYAIVPILLSIAWIWVNPRLFGEPANTHHWASMGTFGERIYLKRKHVKIPRHHLQPCIILQVLSGLGVPLFIYGLYQLDITILIAANCWIMAFKAWFVDRMVWLYLDMKDSSSEYSRWLKP
ncbi:DUF6653 family protein [Agarivorans sp. 1_MG-2023]|uniref:DUF6653 family protein n=1 Tax=Agarivorans sp. 1_MG-2023 TaxID=3062634 RepID=UPI0026E16D43|nr:DUF6653 family protein [Agarivorans sp. 1_MG-2023]MDO6762454.1 hypothetical protein [Agarivorans sp. 1_MG-2023]